MTVQLSCFALLDLSLARPPQQRTHTTHTTHRVSTSRLLRALKKHEARLSGSPAGALLARVKWGCQLRPRPPTFAFFMRGGNEVGAPGERFLAGLLRRLFDLDGVPLRLHIRCGAGGRGAARPACAASVLGGTQCSS